MQAPTDPGETYQVDDGGELVLSAAPNGSSGNPSAGLYYENSIATGTFAFRDPGGTVSDALGGVAIGDAIALPGSDVISVSYGISSLTVVTNLGTTTFTNVGYQGTRPTGYTVGADAATGLEKITFEGLCFMAGTRIATPGGEVPVETLRPGDAVLTADGRVLPVRWLGRQTVATRFADPLHALPVRISAGALGDAVPARDLLVSPGHALLVDGLLIQAGALVNGTTIRRETRIAERFTYFHVELDEHTLLFAEGAAAESFLDGVEPFSFDNCNEQPELTMRESSLPRVKSARQVPPAVRARLAARAQPLAA